MESVTLLRLRSLLPWETFACHELGARYATGDGVEKDEAAAVRWYRRGARRGDPLCQYDLGFMTLLGEGTNRDSVGAVRWLERSAEGGHRQAAGLLSDLYATGEHGVQIDQERAVHWRHRAGEMPPDA